MKVKIILDGGLSSCCASFPPELVREVVKDWLREEDSLEVIDKQQQDWTPDGLALLAEKHLGKAIYPLLYIEDKLVSIGDLPDKNTLLAMLSGKEKFGLTEEDILAAVKRQGGLKKDEG